MTLLMMNLEETLKVWNKKHSYSAVEDLVTSISQLDVTLSDPDKYEITKKEFSVTWAWGNWIPSLNKPDRNIRIVLEIELLIIEKGVVWLASDCAGYRDFVIPQSRAFKYLSQLHPNIDRETLLKCRHEIVNGLPYKTKSMWTREGDDNEEDEGGMVL